MDEDSKNSEINPGGVDIYCPCEESKEIEQKGSAAWELLV